MKKNFTSSHCGIQI